MYIGLSILVDITIHLLSMLTIRYHYTSIMMSKRSSRIPMPVVYLAVGAGLIVMRLQASGVQQCHGRPLSGSVFRDRFYYGRLIIP